MLRRSVRLISCTKGYYSNFKIKAHPLTKVLYSTYDKEFPNPSLPTPASKVFSHDTDILLEQIRKAKTIERLLELTSMHLEVMNAKHIVSAMRSIHDLSKEPTFSKEALMNNGVFQGLCSRLMKIVRLLDSAEIIGVYKALSTLGIKNNTYVMQAILKMMGGHLNSMTLGQLTFLYFLLSRQKPNSLVDGLKLALPLVLQVQIEQQLDSDNMTEIINCMQLACKSRLKPVVIEKVLSTLIKKADLISPSDSVSVIFALLHLETPVDGYKEVLNYCFDLLSKNPEVLNQKQTISMLRISRSQYYYDSKFLFTIAKKIVSEEWNLEQTYDSINHFYKLKFSPQFFVDYFVNAICKEAHDYESKPLYSPLNCVEFLTLTGYHPDRIEEALEIICSSEDKLSKFPEKLLFKVICRASMLGYFPEKYMKKVLEETYLFDSWSISRRQGQSYEFEMLLSTLMWSLQLHGKEDIYKIPSKVENKLVISLCQKNEEYLNPLENFLQHGLGGSQFLQNNLFTNEGIFIDHVLAMRSGNYPVAIQPVNSEDSPLGKTSNAKFVESLSLPDDAKVVTIICADENKYCRDPEVLLGWMDLQIKCLKHKKYYPVVVNYSNFKQLPDREKIPFLMCEIKRAVEEDNVSKTSFFSS